jgi:hypothetical protein
MAEAALKRTQMRIRDESANCVASCAAMLPRGAGPKHACAAREQHHRTR